MIMQTFIRIIADGAIIPAVLIGVVTLLIKIPKDHRYEAYCRIIMAGLTAYLIAKLAATLYQPSLERPFQLLGVNPGALYLNNPGFPSDHTLFVTAISCAVWFETRQKAVTIILAALTIIICIGRVLALVHTPADVVFGVLISLVGALWYLNSSTPALKKKQKTA